MDCAKGGSALKAPALISLHFYSSAFIFCADLKHPVTIGGWLDKVQ
jgi:hypothetical protein